MFLTSEDLLILKQNVLVMNKSQAEKKVYTFHAVFKVDVKPFQNPTETSPFDHFLIRNLCQDFLKQKTDG